DRGGIQRLGRWVHLDSGRLPRACTAQRCEVLQVGGSGALPSDPRLHLVRVGAGLLLSDLPLGSALGIRQGPAVVQAGSYHQTTEPPILLAEGVGAVSRFPQVEDTYRTYSWVVPLVGRDVHPWGVDALMSRIQ